VSKITILHYIFIMILYYILQYNLLIYIIYKLKFTLMESISIALRLRKLCYDWALFVSFLIIYYFIYGYENVATS